MKTLPPNVKMGNRDALRMFVEGGFEKITYCLRHGDGFDLDALTPIVNRCRALVAAYDERMKGMEE